MNLESFKSSDEILQKTHNFSANYINIAFLIDCIAALDRILVKGFNNTQFKSGYIDLYDHENIQKLYNLVNELCDSTFDFSALINRPYFVAYNETKVIILKSRLVILFSSLMVYC